MHRKSPRSLSLVVVSFGKAPLHSEDPRNLPPETSNSTEGSGSAREKVPCGAHLPTPIAGGSGAAPRRSHRPSCLHRAIGRVKAVGPARAVARWQARAIDADRRRPGAQGRRDAHLLLTIGAVVILIGVVALLAYAVAHAAWSGEDRALGRGRRSRVPGRRVVALLFQGARIDGCADPGRSSGGDSGSKSKADSGGGRFATRTPRAARWSRRMKSTCRSGPPSISR